MLMQSFKIRQMESVNEVEYKILKGRQNSRKFERHNYSWDLTSDQSFKIRHMESVNEVEHKIQKGRQNSRKFERHNYSWYGETTSIPNVAGMAEKSRSLDLEFRKSVNCICSARSVDEWYVSPGEPRLLSPKVLRKRQIIFQQERFVGFDRSENYQDTGFARGRPPTN
ncbi:uncharacterized protein [Macrobrachium rosenbergii]|uniref:uncharacterized protein isoform X2 n=1 Tax=Macrobrachium rosenbergii TaxID=79674 RepID=UPI0034D4E63B